MRHDDIDQAMMRTNLSLRGSPEELQRISAELLIARVRSVPLLSPAVRRLITLLKDPANSVSDIARLVELDPNLTIQVLRAANSAANALGRDIQSIQQAINRLGEDAIFSIAVKSSAGDVMAHPLDGHVADETSLWSHSVYTALGARCLAQLNSGGPSAGLAYTTGLLHDMGKAILGEWLSGTSLGLARRCADPYDQEFIAGEEMLLGINHQYAGWVMARHWGLPEVICDGILHHHQPNEARGEARRLADLVHVADMLAHMAGNPQGGENGGYQLVRSWSVNAVLAKVELPEIVSRVRDEFMAIGQALME